VTDNEDDNDCSDDDELTMTVMMTTMTVTITVIVTLSTYSVSQKSTHPLKLFAVFSLRLSIFP